MFSAQASGLRAGSPHHTLGLVVVFTLFAVVCVAEPPNFKVHDGETEQSIEIVRCHFDEGRVVLRRGENLFVLHEGDGLDQTELRLMEITKEDATIAIRQSAPNDGLRLIRVTDSEFGTLLIREFTTDPEGLCPTPVGVPTASAIDNESPPRGSGNH